MINSFSTYLVESQKQIFFTFGRMNPPTIGHEKLLDVLSKKSGANPYRVYLSQSQDAKKNPLEYSEKIKIARKMFPKHARSIILNKNIKNIFDILVSLFDEGYKNITMVVGEDRVNEFDILINKYNGTKGRHGFYNFQNIDVVSAGQRDPDAEGATGMSASKMRAAATDGNYTSFTSGLPKAVSTSDAKKIYNTIRKAMGLQEEKSFVKHVQLQPVSESREKYVHGELFRKGDLVAIKESEEVGEIAICGTNYVVVEMSDKKRIRKWLDDVEKIDMHEEVNTSLVESKYTKLKDTTNLTRNILGGELDPDDLELYNGKTIKEIEKLKKEKDEL